MKHAGIEPLGECGWLVRLGTGTSLACNQAVHRLADHIRAGDPPWLRDIIPAYASLAVVMFDHALGQRLQVRTWLEARIAAIDEERPLAGATEAIEIPVLYGAEGGPDLADLATHAGLTEQAVIERHSAPLYQVAMLGFAPGFPYLLGLDPALSMPRLDRPRTRVPAGSIGIGGHQTGLYPQAGPGGWRLIGRTPVNLFDVRREPVSRLQPGDRLRFVPIDADRFESLLRGEGGLDAG